MRRLRIGVVGVGHMGRRHAEKAKLLGAGGAALELAGVTDTDAARAHEVADALGVAALPDAAGLFRVADAVVVAVPTVHHHAIAAAALEAGLDVLVEKPFAATLAEAEALLALATRGDRVLHVGHLEWYNAATRVIRGQVERPRFVDAHRVGPFPARGTDVDVVRDLMIHDIDILQQVLREEPAEVEAVGVRVVTDHVDVANARLVFASGCVASLTASRVSPTPMRRMRFFQRDGFFSVDFLTQSASVHRRVEGGAEAAPEMEVESVRLDPEDALLAQLRCFVDAVAKRDAPRDSAASALGALRTALRVVDALSGGR